MGYKRKTNYEKASIVIDGLISCEHYRENADDLKSNLIPVLNNVSFVIENNDILGIGSDNKEALGILIEIIGNMRSYYRGVVRLSDLGVRSEKRMVLEKLFYIDSHEMVYEDKTLLELLAFINIMIHKKDKNYGKMQKDVLDIISACKLDDLVNSEIRHLAVTTRMVISILVACMSKSEKIIINATNYFFPQSDINRLKNIFDCYKAAGKTIVIASTQAKIIGMCCDHVLYLNDGRVEVYSTVNDLYKRWDKVVCSIKGEKLEELSKYLKETFKGIATAIVDDALYIKNYSAGEILNKDIYKVALDHDIVINYIRFNSGRVENAFDEIKETFNDIYK